MFLLCLVYQMISSCLIQILTKLTVKKSRLLASKENQIVRQVMLFMNLTKRIILRTSSCAKSVVLIYAQSSVRASSRGILKKK